MGRQEEGVQPSAAMYGDDSIQGHAMKLKSQTLSHSAALLTLLLACGQIASPQESRLLGAQDYTVGSSGSASGQDQSRTRITYMDPVNGLTAEDLVQRALEQNGELLAGHQQVEAGRGALMQARLRANPTVDISNLKQIGPVGGSVVNVIAGLELRRHS